MLPEWMGWSRLIIIFKKVLLPTLKYNAVTRVEMDVSVWYGISCHALIQKIPSFFLFLSSASHSPIPPYNADSIPMIKLERHILKQIFIESMNSWYHQSIYCNIDKFIRRHFNVTYIAILYVTSFSSMTTFPPLTIRCISSCKTHLLDEFEYAWVRRIDCIK